MDAVRDELITDGGPVEFRLFGEVELRAAGRLLDVGTPRQQTVLAALIVDAGRPVAIETLIDRVWDQSPPVEARNVVYSHLSRIRQLFNQAAVLTRTTAVRVERQHAGYVLKVDPDLVDLHRFWRLVDQGHTAHYAEVDRAAALTEALGLWRGPPLAALSGSWVDQVRSSWHRRRLDAVVQWAGIELRLGHPGAVMTALPDLVAEYSLVEPLEVLLMRALHMAGRDAEALDRYTTIRQRLAETLGTDPGPELRALHQALLRGGPPPSPPVDQVVAPARMVPVPAQLPPDLYGFTGRDTELQYLDSLLTAASSQSTAMVISAVSGTAGVGKTALAVHWAHQVAARFPDGQLYVNLRGYDPDQPLSATDALAAFLRSLGVTGAEVPEEQTERARLFRSVLAGRRMLVLLDNARSVEQVEDLLPGTSGCLVLVTSRDRLYGLGVSHGAHRIDLGPLSPSDADELLRTHVGTRIQTEPDAADALVKQCAYLPLALRIAAQLAAARPAESLGDLVEELANEQQRLDLLDAGDPRSCVRTVFSWSYQHLAEGAARLFRLLGVHPGRDVDVTTAAAMASVSVRQAQRSLNTLFRAQLIQETANRRYGMHDLLRAYATDLASSHDEAPDLAAALTRLFDYYLQTAAQAMDRFAPYNRHLVVTIPDLAPCAQTFPDRNSATVWLDTERTNLTATALYAANHGWPTYTCHLSDILWRYFAVGCHYAEAKILCTEALRVADNTTRGGALLRYGIVLWRSGHHQQALDHYEQALDIARKSAAHEREVGALLMRGVAYYWLKRYDNALTQLQQALTIADKLNDAYFRGRAHDTLGLIYQALDRYPEALDSQRQAIDLYRQLDDPHSEAGVRGNLGVTYSRLGRYPEAIEHHQHALTTLRALGDRRGEAETLNDLATTLRDSGALQQALERYQQAITCAEAVRDRYEQIRAHDGLAHCHRALGDTDTARQHHHRVLALQTDLSEAERNPVRGDDRSEHYPLKPVP